MRASRAALELLVGDGVAVEAVNLHRHVSLHLGAVDLSYKHVCL